MKTSNEIREAFLNYWQESPRNSEVIPNASLVPLNDPTLLFVNSGMFPIVPYLSGQPHPLGKRLHNVQRCLRTLDLEEVGDNRHCSMFEMIGNWSLGDFTKEEQIPWICEFLIERCGLDPKRLYVTVFGGDESAGRDDIAINAWKKTFAKYGVKAEFSEDTTNIPSSIEEGNNWKYRIFPYGKDKNWWTRAAIPGEIGGPCSEMFYDFGVKERDDESYHVNDDSGRFVEVGNNVFMEYKMDNNHKWVPLAQKNIDFGGGFERLVVAAQDELDLYLTDLFKSSIELIESISGKKYQSRVELNEETKTFRVMAEHARAATFILADGVKPGNKDQSYILRRLIRRLVRFGLKLGITSDFTKELAMNAIKQMSHAYPHLKENENMIIDEIDKEEINFRRTLEQGLRHLQKIIQDQDLQKDKLKFDGKQAFDLYETYGFPLELTLDELKLDSSTNENITQEFKAEQDKHKAESRAGAEQKFKGGLADASIETTKLHTAHHLLLAALQKLVDPNIKQKGSNITAERLRIDFNFDRKLTPDEVKRVEELVNEMIQDDLEVVRVEMPKIEAENSGAQMEFGQKYPDIVSIYIIGSKENPFSMEFCGGPHVSNTSKLSMNGKRFKITDQENVGSGVKRIKARLS